MAHISTILERILPDILEAKRDHSHGFLNNNPSTLGSSGLCTQKSAKPAAKNLAKNSEALRTDKRDDSTDYGASQSSFVTFAASNKEKEEALT